MDDERSTSREPGPSAPASAPLLIQQRMALRRRRNWGIYMVAYSVVIAVFWTTQITLPNVDLWRLLGYAVLLIVIVMGIREIRSASRATRAFEAEHGADAGIQS